MRLEQLTTKQLERLERKLWSRRLRVDGYQPFGYDRVTMRMVAPLWLEALDNVRRELASRG